LIAAIQSSVINRQHKKGCEGKLTTPQVDTFGRRRPRSHRKQVRPHGQIPIKLVKIVPSWPAGAIDTSPSESKELLTTSRRIPHAKTTMISIRERA
jgi:hypothetical protein